MQTTSTYWSGEVFSTQVQYKYLLAGLSSSLYSVCKYNFLAMRQAKWSNTGSNAAIGSSSFTVSLVCQLDFPLAFSFLKG